MNKELKVKVKVVGLNEIINDSKKLARHIKKAQKLVEKLNKSSISIRTY